MCSSVVACTGDTTSAPPETKLDDDVITVGSFDFAESVLLAEVYSQGLEVGRIQSRRAVRARPP